jgi:rubrerythrin
MNAGSLGPLLGGLTPTVLVVNLIVTTKRRMTLIYECKQCLWRGTEEEWEEHEGHCPTCYCTTKYPVEDKLHG